MRATRIIVLLSSFIMCAACANVRKNNKAIESVKIVDAETVESLKGCKKGKGLDGESSAGQEDAYKILKIKAWNNGYNVVVSRMSTSSSGVKTVLGSNAIAKGRGYRCSKRAYKRFEEADLAL